MLLPAFKMAEEGEGSHCRKPRKRKMLSMAELINKSKELLGISKNKKRKPVHYEFSNDPVTGLRNNKGTYTGQLQKRRQDIPGGNSDDAETLELDCDGFRNGDELLDCSSSQTSTCDAMSGELKDILLEAQELMVRWQGADPPRKQKWSERQMLLNESWIESRSKIFKFLLQANFAVQEGGICQRCLEEVAMIKCNECSAIKYLCHGCDNSIHDYLPFHDRDAIINGHYVPIAATSSMNNKGEWVIVGRSLPLTDVYCTACNSKCKPLEILPDSHCIVVTLRGRFDVNHQRYECQECFKILSTSDPFVVVQSGFWPGSIKDMTYVFDQDLFLHWNILQKQTPGVSERAFLKSLEMFSKQKGRVPIINAAAFGISFKEWKFCEFELNKLRHIEWMECPACGDCQHSVHIDGNMKLYRFKSAGMRKRDSYYGETFVVSNEKVDSHIHKVYQGSKQKKGDEHSRCGESNWRAAANTIKKKKNLSETGLEISGCRHGLAQHAINMMYGEVYGYAHYLQVTYYVQKKVEFFWYDVVCKYWPWLKKNDAGTAQKMQPALSVMHSKAHSWSCQALWGGRWQNGAAATTGEEVEHINSHFSRLGSCTKHMLPEGREELLTEHAIHWNQKKIEGLPRSLAKRYTRAQNQLTKFREELKDLLQSLGLRQSEVSLDIWKEKVLQVARDDEISFNKKLQLSPEEEDYLCHLLTVDNCTSKQELLRETADSMYGKKVRELKPKPCASFESGEAVLHGKVLLYLQTQMEHLHYSVTQMAFNMGKVADGSKQRQKLRNKISSEKDKLEEMVRKYNRLAATNDCVQVQNVENGNFAWKAELSNGDAVPVRTKRLVVDKHMEASRFEEELKLLQKEMLCFVKFYKNSVLPSLIQKQQKLQDSLKGTDSDKITHTEESLSHAYSTSSTQKEVLMAKLALIQDGIDFAFKQMAAGISAFAPVLTDELDAFRQVLLTHQIEEEDDDDNECLNDGGDEDEEDELTSTESSDVASRSGDIVLDALSNIGAAKIIAAPPDEIRAGVTCWKLPLDASQGRYNGRNGSNACSLISLLIGYTLNLKKISHPPCNLNLPGVIVDVLCGCIEIGNRVYDLCRESLPSRYLSIQEAASVLDMWFKIDVGDNLPVRLNDEHEQSTIGGQIREAIISRSSFLAFLILNEKTSLFYIHDGTITYVDTHSHDTSGPVFVTAEVKELDEFCRAVWELERNDETTYGNLVIVNY